MSYLLILLVITIIPALWLYICKRASILESKKRANYYKRKPVPNIQGIPLIITLIACIGILGHEYVGSVYMYSYIIAIILLGIVSTIDLYKPIPSWIRLSFQIILFGVIVIWWDIKIDTVRLWWWDMKIMETIAIGSSIIWFLLCTNAVNRFDGIQAQSSGITSIWSWAIRAVITRIVLPNYSSLTPEILEQLTITQIIASSLGIVALVYTVVEYKPLWLIRDIGTTVYGFSLAYLALVWWAKMWTLLVVLSLVIFDLWRVIINRILIMKKNPLLGDYTHLHHRLIANGRSRSEVRWFVWIRSFVMSILILLQETNSIKKRIILLLMACLFYGINIYLFWIKKLPSEMKVNFTPQDAEKL